jgi:multicomponent Na+:H+ antiporter subunit F
MSNEDHTMLGWALDVAFLLLAASMVLTSIRLARGPSLPDRVVALDLLTVLAVAFSAVFAVSSRESAFLDVAIALALVAFLATVALARFAERRLADRSAPDGQEERGP